MSSKSARVAIVTGASSGIGRASAAALITAGYKVFGTSRRDGADGPAGVTMLACDVTDDASVETMVKTVLNKTGRIDLLVNNAGSGLAGGTEEFSAEEARGQFDVNVVGLHRVTRAVLPTMRSQGSGRIINLGSVLGLVPAPFMALYSATKFAIEGYSESLDHEVRSRGIRVVLVEPGWTNTSFEQNMAGPRSPLPEYDSDRVALNTYLRKLAAAGDTPEFVATVVVKAATDKSPKLRYPAGKAATQLGILRRLVPASVFDKSLRRQLGLAV